MSSTEKVMRGEIYFYDFGKNEGSIQSGVRPVLVIQSDEANKASTTTVVAAITTAVKKQYLPSHIILDEGCGLKKPSMVMLEQIATVNQNDLQRFVGFVGDSELMRAINNGIKKAFGIWAHKPAEKPDIRCLCSRCLMDYKSDPNCIIRRADPFMRIKRQCDKCLGLGYEYIVAEKRSGKIRGKHYI